MDPSASRKALPPAVIALGLVSLLTDVSSEMIFPLLPAFLAARVANAPLLLGAMEGLAELVAAVLTGWAGRWADRAPKLRPMVLGGYAASTLARPWMAFAALWWQPLLVRVVDRIGKGLRSAPRDAMISHWADPSIRGRAFGFHRAMDHTGAAIGAALAFGLVALGVAVDRVFLLSAIPGALGVGAILLAKEPIARPPLPDKGAPLEPVPKRLFFYLGPVALFGLGNATDAFLLLKLAEQGARPELLPLAWLSLHLVKAAVSTPAGRVADRVGKSRVVLAGWTLYALSYLALAASASLTTTFVIIAFYGLYHAFSEGAEKALLADLAPAQARGRAFGLYHSLTGLGSLLAGLLFGALWSFSGSSVAFVTAGGLALVSAVLLGVLLPRARA